jgi:transposase
MTVAPRTRGPGSANLQGRCYTAGGGGEEGEDIAFIGADVNRWSSPMQKLNDLSRSLTPLKPDGTLIAVIEMSLSSWLVAGIVPGVERQPSKKLEVDENALLKLLDRWREEAQKAGHRIERIAVAFEAGRDGFWLARWLRARDIEAHVIHASSVAVSREHRRAKTDRLDTELLKRSFLGWLRGERDHCKMVAIPTIKDEDARRPNRERESLVGEQSRIVNRMKAALIRLGIRGFNPKLKKASERLDGLRTPEGEPIPPNTLAELRRDMVRRRLVSDQIRQIEDTRLERLKQTPSEGPHAMVRLLARVIGVGIETADMLVQEVLSRNMRDRRAIARYAGLTGSPDESGRKRREKGLTRSGNARVKRGMIELAWRFLRFQKDSVLAQWFRTRTENARGARKTMIVALARKLLIALWRLVREGVVPDGVVLRPAS